MAGRLRFLGPRSLATVLFALLFAAGAAFPADEKAACVGQDRELARLADERAVGMLLSEYIWRLDARDFQGYGELFAHGVILSSQGKVIARGKGEVAAMASHYLGALPKELTVRHIASSPRIEVDLEKGMASASSFVMTVRAPRDKPAYIFRVATYHDRFEKADGRWRFASRQELTDWVLEEYSNHYSKDPIK